MKTITEQSAETKKEISAFIYAHKLDDFHSLTALIERMLDKYAQDQVNKISSNIPVNSQFPLSVLEEKVEHFIKYNRKICWEAEMEFGEFCVGEDRLRKFVRELNR